MHIPNEMLNGAICPVSAVVSAAGIGAAAYALVKSEKPLPAPAKFAITGAAIFALQMLNFPIWQGISGHFVGGVLAATLLGVPAGVLCMALLLVTQTLIFADGGLLALGVNIFNMSLLGAGLGGLMLSAFRKKMPATLAAGVAATSVMAVIALALGAELLLDGKGTAAAITALVGSHLILALAEGLATMALVKVFAFAPNGKPMQSRTVITAVLAIAAFLALSPLASASPDALEWVLAKFSLLSVEVPVNFVAPLPDYQVSAALPEVLSGMLAGIIGVAIMAVVGAAVAFCVRKVQSVKIVK